MAVWVLVHLSQKACIHSTNTHGAVSGTGDAIVNTADEISASRARQGIQTINK